METMVGGALGSGSVSSPLDDETMEALIAEGVARLDVDGRRVLVVIPDGTRTAPLPLLFAALNRSLGMRARSIDYLIALGTHRAMEPAAIARMLDIAPESVAAPGPNLRIFNHAWADDEQLVHIGDITPAEVTELSEGRLSLRVPVRINRMVTDHDLVLLCGPVFPHEVAGFSGGTKYLFPGVAGREIIDFTHWLGALCTSLATIGVAATPVRRAIDRAAALLDTPVQALTFAMRGHRVHGLWMGTPGDAFAAAAHVSAQLNIEWVAHPYRRVLSMPATRYEDLWTAAKAMYKTEPVVEDGGEVVIYAPHLKEVSFVHGRQIIEVGYHVRDFFTSQWERFGQQPWAVLAHSTHVKGAGDYSAASGVETPRIQVTLATGIPADICARINLGYLDPATINPSDWADRGDEGILVVPNAGERLFRVGPRTL